MGQGTPHRSGSCRPRHPGAGQGRQRGGGRGRQGQGGVGVTAATRGCTTGTGRSGVRPCASLASGSARGCFGRHSCRVARVAATGEKAVATAAATPAAACRDGACCSAVGGMPAAGCPPPVSPRSRGGPTSGLGYGDSVVSLLRCRRPGHICLACVRGLGVLREGGSSAAHTVGRAAQHGSRAVGLVLRPLPFASDARSAGCCGPSEVPSSGLHGRCGPRVAC